MLIDRTKAMRRRIALATLLATAVPAAAAAQAPVRYPAGAVVQPLPKLGDPAELLATALRTLAVEPNNIEALTAAGRNALILGDPNAAVGFFGRADELAPRNGRVKAGLGGALVQLEKPQEALRLFAEAARLGVPDADIAEDRGLAYDLVGDNRRAQQDYATVLAARPDDDTARRRLALSQGISGNRAAAIATLDPLIRKRDIAGWRAQTFVLAMTGDTKGASDITHIMVPQQADMLQPFLVRLATLSPADKARAVHFGEMPSTGRPYSPTQLANTGTPATYAASPSASAYAPAHPTVPARVTRSSRSRDMTATQSDLAPIGTVAVTQAAPRPSASALAPSARPASAPAAGGAAIAVAPPAVVAPVRPALPTEAPLAGIALSPAPAAVSNAPTQMARVEPVRSPPPGSAAWATGQAPSASTPGITTTALPPSNSVRVAGAGPAAVTTATGTGGVPPMPVAPAPGFGHFDLPHDTAARTSMQTRAASHVPVSPVAEKPALAETIAKKAQVEKTDTEKAIAPTVRPATPVLTPRGGKEEAAAAAKAPSPRRADDADADARSSSATKAASRAGRGRHDMIESTDEGTATEKGKGRAAQERSTKTHPIDESATHKAGPKGRHEAASPDTEAAAADKAKGKRHEKMAGKEDTGGKSDASSRSAASDKSAKQEKGGGKGSASDKNSAGGKIYVQVAGGANKTDMDKAWSGLKTKAPDLLKGHAPSTTPLRATNRLLVGPFEDEAAAQAFVNKMAGKGLSSFTFKSAKGQKIEKIDTSK